MRKYLLIITFLLTLPGCIPTAIVAGATAGGAVIYDNRSVKTMLSDRDITYQAQSRLDADSQIKHNAHISVATFNHVVLIVGQAPTSALRARALSIVKSVPKIKRIYNQITIEAPSSIMTRSSDSWITAKIKAAMLAEPGLNSTQMKVVTENGVVYLMGLTSPSQGRLAAQKARKISGVQKVVKVLEYLH